MKVKLSSRAQGGVVVLLGLGLVLGSGYQMHRAWRVSNGREVEGRVVSADEAQGQVVVRFPGVRRTEERAFPASGERARLRKGSKLQVLVLDEETAYLQGEGPTPLGVVAPFLAGIVVAGVGVALALRQT
ncbi:MAG: hypothetical protein AB7N76_05515 [Planctomycetota bacterium]